LPDVGRYVRDLEAVLVAALRDFGIEAHRDPRYTGVWVGDEKIAAIGVKVARGRTRHGFALNVDPDLGMFRNIVPCGIADRGVTSMRGALGRGVEFRAVVDAVVAQFVRHFGYSAVERQDVAWRVSSGDLAAVTRNGDRGAGDRGASIRLLGRLAAAGGEP